MSKQPAKPNKTKKELAAPAAKYLAIQDRTSSIIAPKRPRPHSSINPLAGNSLY